ncbi:hypothetical protein [Trichlorobacter lovleyi]|uniref:hypothetical protein n=1 Tax=Trichlorobacter lovleyi TaxID=313985 RepID=UPI003D119927
MSNLGDDSDTIEIDFPAMLEAMQQMKSSPDYHAIVKADWESIHAKLKETIVDLVKSDTIPGLSEKYQDRLSLEYNLAVVIDGKMPVNKSTIQEVLPNFPNETIMEISKVVFQFDVERIWENRSHAGQARINLAKRKRKLLAKTKTMLCKALSMMENHLLGCVSTKGYPAIVSLPLEDSVRSLNESLKLADAYMNLLDAELKKYSGEGFPVKHHPIWKEIFVPFSVHIKAAQLKQPSLKYESHVSLTAKLLTAVYPWYWGKIDHITVEKNIRPFCEKNE